MANFVGMVDTVDHKTFTRVGTVPHRRQEVPPEQLFEEAEKLLKKSLPGEKGDERDRAARVQDGILHKLISATEEGNLPFRKVETLLKRFETQRCLFKGVRERFIGVCPNSSLKKEQTASEFRNVLVGWGSDRKGPPPDYLAKKATKRAKDRELRKRMKGSCQEKK